MTLSMVCGAVLGVQRPEDEVPGLRRRHGERDGLEVAHLAHEYHVGVLPQDVLESLGKALGVLVDLALVDDALLVFVQELDGVLHAHDVLVPGLVDLVDHGGEGGGFAAPVGPVTRTSPRGFSVSSSTAFGSPSSLMLFISLGMVRKAAPKRPSGSKR